MKNTADVLRVELRPDTYLIAVVECDGADLDGLQFYLERDGAERVWVAADAARALLAMLPAPSTLDEMLSE